MILRNIDASKVRFNPTRDWLLNHDVMEVYQCILFAQGGDAADMDGEFEDRNASGFRRFASIYGEAFNFDATCDTRHPITYSYRVCDTIRIYHEKYKVLSTTGDGYLFAIYRVGYVSVCQD